MSGNGTPAFEQKKLLHQAASISWAIMVGIDAYLREQGQAPEPFADWLGRRLAFGWQIHHGNLQKIALNIAFDLVALGAPLRGFEVDENEATVRFTLPDIARASGMEAPAALSGQFFGRIVDSLDLDFEWEQEGEVVTYHMSTRAKG